VRKDKRMDSKTTLDVMEGLCRIGY
jgi:hypothetical protein